MKKSKDREICIIGGGMGSISAAIYLRSKGYKVSVFEKNSTLGGRANIIEEKGFRFDVGPSLLNYPWIFENLFEAAGEKMDDHIDLIEIKRVLNSCGMTRKLSLSPQIFRIFPRK